MDYSSLVEAYEKVEKTTKRLEKTKIISELLDETQDEEIKKVILLLQGRVFPQWDERKIGISSQIALKAINIATGVETLKLKKEWAKKGDLGLVIEELIKNKKQMTLFHKKLTIDKVYENIVKLSELEGDGTVSKKLQLITELLLLATPNESKFIIRTLIGELRIGIANAVIRDAIVWSFLPRVEKINEDDKRKKEIKINSIEELEKVDFRKYNLIKTENEKLSREIYNSLIEKVEHAYNLTNDLGEVALAIKTQKISKISSECGIPINPMLAIRTNSIKEGLDSVGRPALIEYKYDGARIQIHYEGKEVKLFTRRLENVTKQFHELTPLIKKYIKGKNFILDAEVVGYDEKSKKYLPFQNISQRIRRKYDIEETAKEIPVKLMIFDVMYLNDESLLEKTQEERRKIIEKIIEPSSKVNVSESIISESEKEIEKFYNNALKKGNEGVMLKSLHSIYKPGRRVGGWVKHKPLKETLDLVITEAEWGEGKRTKWLSSFTLACRDKNKLVTLGKVGTGIAEKGSGLTFEYLTKELKPLIIDEKGKQVFLKAKLILEVGYEEIQKSTNYSSGYALRFPKVIKIREDLGFKDIENIETLEKFYRLQFKKR